MQAERFHPFRTLVTSAACRSEVLLFGAHTFRPWPARFELPRLAQALERLPELSRELGEGSVIYSHVRELTRVAIPETDRTWLKAVCGRTVREVERLVSGRKPGALPDSPPSPERQRHVLRFEVSGETLASFREAVSRL